MSFGSALDILAVIVGLGFTIVVARQMQAWARAHSLTDALTGLKNRMYVEQMVDHDASSCLRRYADWRRLNLAPQQCDLVFLLVTLDDRERVATQSGRKAADRLLVEIAHCLERTCRDSDVVVRWGGDAFMILGRFTNGPQANVLAERVRRAVSARTAPLPNGATVSTTCSIGYAVFPFTPTDS